MDSVQSYLQPTITTTQSSYALPYECSRDERVLLHTLSKRISFCAQVLALMNNNQFNCVTAALDEYQVRLLESNPDQVIVQCLKAGDPNQEHMNRPNALVMISNLFFTDSIEFERCLALPSAAGKDFVEIAKNQIAKHLNATKDMADLAVTSRLFAGTDTEVKHWLKLRGLEPYCAAKNKSAGVNKLVRARTKNTHHPYNNPTIRYVPIQTKKNAAELTQTTTNQTSTNPWPHNNPAITVRYVPIKTESAQPTTSQTSTSSWPPQERQPMISSGEFNHLQHMPWQ